MWKKVTLLLELKWGVLPYSPVSDPTELFHLLAWVAKAKGVFWPRLHSQRRSQSIEPWQSEQVDFHSIELQVCWGIRDERRHSFVGGIRFRPGSQDEPEGDDDDVWEVVLFSTIIDSFTFSSSFGSNFIPSYNQSSLSTGTPIKAKYKQHVLAYFKHDVTNHEKVLQYTWQHDNSAQNGR